LFRTTAAAGLRLQICDVSPAALCNTFRYNYGELEDCTMLLDIGAKTSNLLFFEKGKVFSRSINLGANSITQDFANEAKLKFDPADKIKIDEGFVSLGGAYEEPENQHQAAIAKIARQFMTRLHIQVNQTMQFYRGQQGGSAPQRLFLAGGASIMPYTAQFFAEKLNVPVEFLNPFRSVQIDPGVNLEELARVAHSMGEVVGLGLRNMANCPVELNLMPESTLRWQSFNQKKPYFLATLGSLVLMALAVGFLFEKLAGVKKDQLEKIQPAIDQLKGKESSFNTVNRALKSTREHLEQETLWLEERYLWADILREMRGALIRAEDTTRRKFGHDTGVWIEMMSSLAPQGGGGFDPNLQGGGAPGDLPRGNAGMEAAFRARYPMVEGRSRSRGGVDDDFRGGRPAMGAPGPGGEGAGGEMVSAAAANSNQVAMVTLVCRGVSLTQALASGNAASANTDIAFALESALKESPLFDAKETQLTQKVTEDEATGTFTFGLTLKLKRPLKL
jgi:type IV pilus assembly protein PilM